MQVRTFIAIDLGQEARQALSKLIARLKENPGSCAARWVRSETIHLTLRFLGDVSSEDLPALYRAVQAACIKHGPFEVTLAGLGCFPHTRRPRVVWTGVREDTGQLMALQRDVEKELTRLGYPREARRFTPHLTLARVNKQALAAEIEALGAGVVQANVGVLGMMNVDHVSVMRSDLQPRGAVYTELYRVSLSSTTSA